MAVARLQLDSGVRRPTQDIIETVFFQLPSGAEHLPTEVQALLDEHQPLPEQSIARLCNLAADTDDSEAGAGFRRAVVDVDTLFCDLRWHLGHALVILKAYPDLEKPENDAVATFGRIGMPNRAWVLVRPLVAEHEKIFYQDMMDRRPGGGRVAGWLLHMLVDDAIFRAIGTLDRLAHMLMLAAKAPAPRGRMYFRSGKLELLRKDYGVPIPDSLIDLSRSESMAFLLDYRDGFAHTARPMARAMRTPPVDSYSDAHGERVNMHPIQWSAEELFGVGVLGLAVCRDAIDPVADVCAHYIKPPPMR